MANSLSHLVDNVKALTDMFDALFFGQLFLRSRYFKLEGSTVHVEIFNVAGHDRVHWEGGRGYVEACGEAEDVKILCEQVIPVELPELTGRMKVTGPKYLNAVERQCAIACAQ